MHSTRALINYCSELLVGSLPHTAKGPSLYLVAAALLGITGGLAGCGATAYAGMTRAGASQVPLEDSNFVLAGAGKGRLEIATWVGSRARSIEKDNVSESRFGIDQDLTQAESRPISGEAAFAVKPVSSLKLRKQVDLQSLTCANQSMVGAGTTACVVTLSSGAPSGGVTVGLSTNNGVVSLPGSVVVPAGASSASFAATVAAVSVAQTASITAAENGSAKNFSMQLNVAAPVLTISSTNVSFGSVAVGQTATISVILTSTGNAPLTISSISVAGSLFKATGVSTPLTLNPGDKATLTLQFYSDHTSSYTGIVTIASNSAQNSATINMSADGVPSLSGLTCNTESYSAAGTDSCLISLYGTAPYTGYAITLASNNPSIAVPSTVTVPSGAMSASFTATVSAVSSSQTGTLTATAGGIAKSFAVQLTLANAALTANATSVPFGSVLVNSPAEQSITLKSTGTSPVTISSLAISGTGFNTSGMTTPLTLNPGQSANLNVQFTPTSAGSFSGQLTIGSTATGGAIAIPLSGTGYGHKVQLSWNAPASGGVAGYNIYRTLSGSTGYQRLNSATVALTGYSDGNVQSGTSYVYYVTSVDGSGQESLPSNRTLLAVPTP